MRRWLLPSILVAILIAVSVAVGLAVPVLGPWPSPLRIAGIVLVFAGTSLTAGGVNRFAKLGTNVLASRDPDLLVESGPFRWTRNPMYIGYTILLAGVAVVVGSLTAWIGPVAFVVISDLYYIPHEERRMAATFGEEYEDYRRRVPRWIGPVGRSG